SVSIRGGPSSGTVTARFSSGSRRRRGPRAVASTVARRGRRPSPGALLLGYARVLTARWTRLRGALAQFLYGLTGYEFARHALEIAGWKRRMLRERDVTDVLG